MTEVVVIGGGGHAKVLISVLHKLKWTILGYTDSRAREAILGVEWLGRDEALSTVAAGHPGCGALVGVGKIDAAPERLGLQQEASVIGLVAPVAVSPDAVVNEGVRLGAGTVVFDGVVVNSGVTTGRACILNTHATLEHDCTLGDNVHLAPGATVSGGVRIGEHCMVGAGSTIVQGVSVRAGCVIGAGAVVVKDVERPGTYVGCPARRLLP